MPIEETGNNYDTITDVSEVIKDCEENKERKWMDISCILISVGFIFGIGFIIMLYGGIGCYIYLEFEVINETKEPHDKIRETVSLIVYIVLILPIICLFGKLYNRPASQWQFTNENYTFESLETRLSKILPKPERSTDENSIFESTKTKLSQKRTDLGIILLVNLPITFNVTTMYWLSHFNETRPRLQLFTNLSQVVVGFVANSCMCFHHIDICNIYDLISNLNNDITEYGIKCKEKTETLDASSHENVNQPSCSKSVHEPSSSRSTAPFQSMDGKNRKRKESHHREDKTESKRVEEEGISMDLLDNDGEESVDEPVNNSVINFSSKVEDFLEYVEKKFQDIVNLVKSFSKLKSFAYSIVFTVYVINTMQAAITAVHYFNETIIDKTEPKHWWILYMFVSLLSIIPLLGSIIMASMVGEKAKQTSILFNKALSKVEKKYRNTFTTEKVLDMLNVYI